jgi:hypothetical protein
MGHPFSGEQGFIVFGDVPIFIFEIKARDEVMLKHA